MSGDNSIDVLIYNHHDDMWREKEECLVTLEVSGIPFQKENVNVIHYRIDEDHSNAFQVWSDMGRPDYPTGVQFEKLKSRDGLEMLCPPQMMKINNGNLSLDFRLPVNGISLIRIQQV
jgi:xylan 1,4-beta-xylosidase